MSNNNTNNEGGGGAIIIVLLLCCLVASVVAGGGWWWMSTDGGKKDFTFPFQSEKKKKSGGGGSGGSGGSGGGTQEDLSVGEQKEPCRTGEWTDEGDCVEGKMKQVRTVTGDCGDDVEAEQEVPCCSPGEWKNEGVCRKLPGSELPDEVSQKQVRTLVGECPSHVKTEQEVACCLVTKDWFEISPCTFGNKAYDRRKLEGTCPEEEWPTLRTRDCTFSHPNCAAADTNAECPRWARAKLCDNGWYWDWMQTNCATSCQRTGAKAKYDYGKSTCRAPDFETWCVDTATDCEARKARGECDTNYWKNWIECKKTCEVWGCQATNFGTHKPDDDYWYRNWVDGNEQNNAWKDSASGTFKPDWCSYSGRYCKFDPRPGYDGPGKDGVIEPGYYYGLSSFQGGI